MHIKLNKTNTGKSPSIVSVSADNWLQNVLFYFIFLWWLRFYHGIAQIFKISKFVWSKSEDAKAHICSVKSNSGGAAAKFAPLFKHLFYTVCILVHHAQLLWWIGDLPRFSSIQCMLVLTHYDLEHKQIKQMNEWFQPVLMLYISLLSLLSIWMQPFRILHEPMPQ